MTRRFRCLALLAALVAALILPPDGALAQETAKPKPAAAPARFPSVTDRLRAQALAFEKEMRLDDALTRWRYLFALEPRNTEAASHILVLRAQIKLMAATHFERGVSLSRAKKNDDALREFVLALGYDPGHAEAKDYIRNKLKPPDWVYYTAVPGDTMAVIAKKAYQDEKRTFIVAGFNDLPVTAKVEPGQVFKLPIIESDLRKPSVNVNEVLGKAKTMLEQGNFDDAIATVESILVYDAGNAMARAMINTAYYNQGKAYQGANQPLEALTAFKNVEPGYKDTQAAMDTLQTALKASAEVEYKKGVEAFIKEDLNLAIAQWEVTLRMDPAHPKAQEDLQNARQLRDRLREVQQ